MRPRAHVQNQHTRELISAWNKHNKGLSHLQLLSPGMHVNTRHINSTRGTSSNEELLRMYLWWSLCTLYLHACQVRVTIGDSGHCVCFELPCLLIFNKAKFTESVCYIWLWKSNIGPRIWNSLPPDLRHCSTLSSFKAKLKTVCVGACMHVYVCDVWSMILISVMHILIHCGGGGVYVCVCVCVCVCSV